MFHAPLIRACPDLALAAVVTGAPERRAALHAACPEAALLDTPEELWARAADLDLVVVATPNRGHVPLAQAALRAGLPVVVDKPLAPSAAEARALIALARARGRLLTVFQNRRWDGDFLTVQRLVTEAALGAVRRFESRFERWSPIPRQGWRESGDPAEAGCYLRFYAGVAAAVRSGAPPPVDPEDAAAALDVIEAARASAERGQVVELRY